MALRIRRERASAQRVPAVARGTAIVYTRYGEEKSVVMNPDDFHELAGLEDDLAAVAAAGLPLSDLALGALRAEAVPGPAVEDPASIEAILRR